MNVRRLAVLLTLLVTLAACGDGGATAVPRGALAQQVANQVNAKKLVPTNVRCPDELKAEKGAKVTCTVIANQLKYAVYVTAIKVKGKDVAFNLKVPGPPIVTTEALESQVTVVLTKRKSGSASTVDCTKELKGVKGRSTTCEVTDDKGRTGKTTVTISAATFLNVGLKVTSK